MKFPTAVLCALLLLAVSGLQAQGFNDEFDGPTLDPRWTWLREAPTSWMLWNGMLEITTGRGALNGTSFNNVRNMLLQEAPDGTFWCETQVNFRPVWVFHNAGLLYYQDDDNYIRVSRGILENHNGLWMEYEVDGQTGFAHVDDVIEDIVTLRLSRYQDTVFTASYQVKGEPFTLIAQLPLPLANAGARIGLQAANGDGLGARGDDRPAQFDYFRVHLTTNVHAPATAPAAFRVLGQYPQPLRAGENGSLLVAVQRSATLRLRLFNVLGQLQWTSAPRDVQAGTERLDFRSEGLAPGVYLLQLDAGGTQFSQRITVVR